MLQDNQTYATELNEFETTRFNASVPAQPQLNINVHYSHSQSRSKVESYILDKFQHRHSATIREFMPVLIDLGYENTKSAAVGIRPGVNRTRVGPRCLGVRYYFDSSSSMEEVGWYC
jgi:hypothetical protein